jgi:hypothetical protein
MAPKGYPPTPAMAKLYADTSAIYDDSLASGNHSAAASREAFPTVQRTWLLSLQAHRLADFERSLDPLVEAQPCGDQRIHCRAQLCLAAPGPPLFDDY